MSAQRMTPRVLSLVLSGAFALAVVGVVATRGAGPETVDVADAHAEPDIHKAAAPVSEGAESVQQAEPDDRTWVRPIPSAAALALLWHDGGVRRDSSSEPRGIDWVMGAQGDADAAQPEHVVADAGVREGLCAWFEQVRVPDLNKAYTLRSAAADDGSSACELDGDDVASQASQFTQCVETAHGAWALELRNIEVGFSWGNACGEAQWSADLWVTKLENADGGPTPQTASVQLDLWHDYPQMRLVSGLAMNMMRTTEIQLSDTLRDEDIVLVTASRRGHECAPDVDDPEEHTKFHLGMKNGKPRWVPPPKPKR